MTQLVGYRWRVVLYLLLFYYLNSDGTNKLRNVNYVIPHFKMPYHAISIPEDFAQDNSSLDPSSNTSAKDRVFETKEDALKALKTNKKSRYKAFESYTDALYFATHPYDVLSENGGNGKSVQVDKDPSSGENKTVASNEGCIFKSLTPQELKKLKEAITKEDELAYDKLVAENPRYLTTPCDAPSILHSGTRANALHIAATAKSAKMTRKILDSVLDPTLMERMCPGESAEARARRYTD